MTSGAKNGGVIDEPILCVLGFPRVSWLFRIRSRTSLLDLERSGLAGRAFGTPFPFFSGRVVFPRFFFVFLVSRQTFGTVDFPSPFLQLIRFPPLG